MQAYDPFDLQRKWHPGFASKILQLWPHPPHGAFLLKIKEKHRHRRRAGEGVRQLQGVIYF